MAIVKSLSGLARQEDNIRYQKGSFSLSNLVLDISKDLLGENPDLVINAYYDQKRRAQLEANILNILEKSDYFAPGSKREIIKSVFDFMFGYGQLQKYIDDEDVSDIDGVNHSCFSIIRKGVRENIDINFGSAEDFDIYCKLIAVRNGGILNENDNHCRVADLKNHLRINISIFPRNISGSSISIRKHRKKGYSLKDLYDLNMVDEKSLKIIKEYLYKNKTILLCGKGGSGKTTLLRALINALPEMERVLICESDAELYPDKKHCIEQRVKRKNEGGNPISLDMLIKDGLTMSLDTYCIGEIVGEEALAFLNASCSGHRFLTTMHATSAKDCGKRLSALAKMVNGASNEAMLLAMFGEGIHLIIHMDSFKINEIYEVKGFNHKIQDLEYDLLYKGGQ